MVAVLQKTNHDWLSLRRWSARCRQETPPALNLGWGNDHRVLVDLSTAGNCSPRKLRDSLGQLSMGRRSDHSAWNGQDHDITRLDLSCRRRRPVNFLLAR